MSYAAHLARQNEQFIQEAKKQGLFVGLITGFAAGIIFASVWILAWTLFFR